MNITPNLFSFHDYRIYIKEMLEHFKKSGSGYTLRGLAKKIKVQAPYLSLVLKGQRPLSKRVQLKLIAALGFDQDQAKYFSLLCTVADSNKSEERIEALEKIQNFKEYRDINPKEAEVFRYLNRWVYSAVREMVQLPGFKLEPQWIYKNLSQKTSHNEIITAISFLVKHGFIQTSANGKIQLEQKVLNCSQDIYRTALGVFHRQILDLAASSIETIPREQRHIRGQMLPIPSKKFGEITALLDECLKKISAISDNSKESDSIYQFEFVGFPIAKVCE